MIEGKLSINIIENAAVVSDQLWRTMQPKQMLNLINV